jgi:hypothetical protein
MDSTGSVTVRMFGVLHASRRAEGLPTTIEVEVPEEGTTARQLALELDLDLDLIEGAFVNRSVCSIDHAVFPGDRLAFVPRGTPGPHRFYLGLYNAGRSGADSGGGAGTGGPGGSSPATSD